MGVCKAFQEHSEQGGGVTIEMTSNVTTSEDSVLK